MTFFGKADPKFLPIPDDKRILTEQFLDASSQILPFFGKFGGVFSLVKNDIEGNIMKTRKKFDQDKEKYRTVNDILEDTGVKGDSVLKNAHIGLVWLTRGLDFLQKLLELIVKDYEEGTNPDGGSKELIVAAYQVTLSKHHGIVMRNIFGPLCSKAPYKKDIMEKLKENESITSDMVIADIKEYNKNLSATSQVIQEAIDTLGVKG